MGGCTTRSGHRRTPDSPIRTSTVGPMSVDPYWEERTPAGIPPLPRDAPCREIVADRPEHPGQRGQPDGCVPAEGHPVRTRPGHPGADALRRSGSPRAAEGRQQLHEGGLGGLHDGPSQLGRSGLRPEGVTLRERPRHHRQRSERQGEPPCRQWLREALHRDRAGSGCRLPGQGRHELRQHQAVRTRHLSRQQFRSHAAEPPAQYRGSAVRT